METEREQALETEKGPATATAPVEVRVERAVPDWASAERAVPEEGPPRSTG
jgi:hypothetical protein